ncbi:MAG: hypothetical protein IJR18_09735 [Campylobacter sp.]|nr:hypothetical protein [Campylobacter sp.]
MRKIFLFGLCVLVFAEPNISTDSQDSYKIKREIIEKDGDLSLDDLKALAPNKDGGLNISDENIAEINSVNMQTTENLDSQAVKNSNLHGIENSTKQVAENSNPQSKENSKLNWGEIIVPCLFVWLLIYKFIYMPIKRVFSFFGGGKSQSKKYNDEKATKKSKPVKEERYIGSAIQKGNIVQVYDQKGSFIFSLSGELYGFTNATVSILKRGIQDKKRGQITIYDNKGKYISSQSWWQS